MTNRDEKLTEIITQALGDNGAKYLEYVNLQFTRTKPDNRINITFTPTKEAAERNDPNNISSDLVKIAELMQAKGFNVNPVYIDIEGKGSLWQFHVEAPKGGSDRDVLEKLFTQLGVNNSSLVTDHFLSDKVRVTVGFELNPSLAEQTMLLSHDPRYVVNHFPGTVITHDNKYPGYKLISSFDAGKLEELINLIPGSKISYGYDFAKATLFIPQSALNSKTAETITNAFSVQYPKPVINYLLNPAPEKVAQNVDIEDIGNIVPRDSRMAMGMEEIGQTIRT